jgi:hypothetical protein
MKSYGPEYEEFCANVPRWIPHLRPCGANGNSRSQCGTEWVNREIFRVCLANCTRITGKPEVIEPRFSVSCLPTIRSQRCGTVQGILNRRLAPSTERRRPYGVSFRLPTAAEERFTSVPFLWRRLMAGLAPRCRVRHERCKGVVKVRRNRVTPAGACGTPVHSSVTRSRFDPRRGTIPPSKAAIRVSSRKLGAERSSNVGNCDCNIAGRNVRVLVDADVAVSKVNKALPCLVNVRRACGVIELVECELA